MLTYPLFHVPEQERIAFAEGFVRSATPLGPDDKAAITAKFKNVTVGLVVGSL
jgi:hypothetical protein